MSPKNTSPRQSQSLSLPKSFLLGNVSIDTIEFASRGNAVLGIRDSGKTYTATELAEKLMDAGIPILAFDPVGVWRFLRIPGKGKGYPVVVAGGRNGDLPLTVKTAPDIVRAAMKNGLSLVIDLFSPDLSKADWKRIVADCARILTYENPDFGLRHIFIEEAAEFVPQRVDRASGLVFSEVEKMVRMGGNSGLGVTLINQRAEDSNVLRSIMALESDVRRQVTDAEQKGYDKGVQDMKAMQS